MTTSYRQEEAVGPSGGYLVVPLQVPDELRDLADHVEVVQQVLEVLVQLPGAHVDLVCKQANQAPRSGQCPGRWVGDDGTRINPRES